ncbi:50S ribosomal protein L22 [Candidatus Microgenomates bacterium]|nr:50S ribosomal protein L22 [Candidatus Microgenomates bacterium]
MDYIATAKSIRISPRKLRGIVNVVKKLTPAQAVNKLEFLAKSGSSPILKTLNSALANGKNAAGLSIKNILVDEGVKMKRRDTSHRPGREGLIQKRTSYIKVVLTDGK